MAEDKYSKSTTPADAQKASNEIDKIYKMRVKYFPDNLGKVYSDWANSLVIRDVPQNEIFTKLAHSFKNDPAGMRKISIRNWFSILMMILLKL